MAVRIRRNVLFAGLLAVLFAAGLVVVLRPVLWVAPASDSAGPAGRIAATGAAGATPGPSGTVSYGPNSSAPGYSSPPAGGTTADMKLRHNRSVRVGAPTLDNSYPGYSYPPCIAVVNRHAGLPVRITQLAVSPPSVFVIEACTSIDLAFDDVVPCAPDVELTPPGQHPSRACGFWRTTSLPGAHDGTVTITTEATCTSRALPPCTELPAAEHPSESTPVIAVTDSQFHIAAHGPNPVTTSPDLQTPDSASTSGSTPAVAPTTSDPATSSSDAGTSTP